MKASRSADTRLKYFWLLQVSIAVLSFGSVLAKLASQERLFSARFLFFYGGLLAMLAAYAILWQKVLKHLDLTIAYASKGLIVIWTLFWAVFLFDESIAPNHVIGGLLILAGVVIAREP